MKFETLQKLAKQFLGEELKKDDTIETEGQAYSAAGYYLTETEKPIMRKSIGGERDTGRKFWELGVSVYIPGNREEPPSEDYAVIGTFESLDNCLEAACNHAAACNVANSFQSEAECEIHLDEETY